MGKIVISENISIDGVVQDPTGELESGRGNWFTLISAEDRAAWAEVEVAEALAAEALLMGRRSHDWFVGRGWASRTDVWGERLRALPKYVVSSSALDGPEWANSTVLKGGAVEEVTRLKRQVAGDIVVYGSGRLAHTLLAHDLADELRLMTYPVVVGKGARLYPETTAMKPLRLVETRTVGTALALLTYRSVRGT
ncbi:MAG TPA: dihydrofolate reductase family protein [Streptosporangiaceae bacterium]|jgi:dihydrofolate reductase